MLSQYIFDIAKIKVMKHVLPFIFLFISTTNLLAGPVNWTGAGDGTSWEDVDNWDTGAEPDATSDITITNATVSINSGTTAYALSIILDGTLTVDTGAELTIENTPTFTPSIELIGAGNALVVNGTLTISGAWIGVKLGLNTGSFTIGATGVLDIDNSLAAINGPPTGPDLVTNDGVIHFDNPPPNCCSAAISAFLTNTGTILLEDNGGLYGVFDNSGVIDLLNSSQGLLLWDGESVNTGTININSSLDGGFAFFLADATLTNSGQINIISPASYGIAVFNENQILNNLASGEISISGGADGGILRGGTQPNSFVLNNDGDISIENSGNIGIDLSTSTINNNAGGSLAIGEVTTGISAGTGTNTLMNSGTLDIANTILRGIDMSGSNNTITNSPTGTLTLDSIGTSAIAGDIDNDGTLAITNGCSNSAIDGDLDNSGIVTMTNLTNGGVVGSFLNSGTVDLNTLGAGAIGVFGSGQFTNSGILTMTNVVGTKMTVNGTSTSWTNSGEITVIGGSGNGLTLTGAGSSSQSSDGTLAIDGANLALRVDDCGLSLDGMVSVSNSSTAVSTLTDADFTIETTGVLNIIDCDRGFLANTASINENMGSINMSGLINSEGLSVRNGAQFVNFGSGILTIDRSGISSIVVDDASLINIGEMNLASNLTTISNLGTFENRPTGLIKILDFGNVGITNSTGGTLTNEGTLDITKNGSPVDIQNINGGMMVNTGTIIVRN